MTTADSNSDVRRGNQDHLKTENKKPNPEERVFLETSLL
jgi:hypothetical protein